MSTPDPRAPERQRLGVPERQRLGVPERPSLDGLEARWAARWEEAGVHVFDRARAARLPRDRVFSIDTPPPTVSGSLHVGHCFSYTHTDVVARYRRMRGDEVFYPMGWDDSGLPTERRVQNLYGVRCEPSLPDDPGFTPPERPDPKRPVSVSRRTFVDLCERASAIDEQAFERLWRRLGLSVDWSLTYRTVGREARIASQRAFLRNLARGEAYAASAPTLWDVTFRTAVAQAEVEDREWPGAYHRIAFSRPDGTAVHVETTRPELLPACVALVAHPDDDRWAALVGTTATSPLFGVEVPVLAHPDAEPGKGSGLAMCCTFGDLTDVRWWRELQLPSRVVIERDGRLAAAPPFAVTDPAGRAAYARLARATVHTARERVVAMLAESGDLDGAPRPVTRPVKFYEKGDRPLEIVDSFQWYLRDGGRDDALRDALLARGAEPAWHPASMRIRYDTWVGGLNGDWLVSRQRFFGVPVPVWWPIDESGIPDVDPIVPDEAALPVDPAVDVPPGYRPEDRDVPSGFSGDPDVLDTWATSSLTPQIAAGWERDPELYRLVYPMDLRPQAHEIIRTWLFYTVVRAHLEEGVAPFRHVAISGWVLDPDRKKMAKSKGNTVTPEDLLAEYGSDAVRYWAATGRPGVDTAFDTAQMKIGRRLATKILHASRFVLGTGAAPGESAAGAAPDESAAGAAPAGGTAVDPAAVTVPLDRALLARLAGVVREATAALEGYDHTRALERTEEFFWFLCDDYLELVKARAYGEAGDAAAGSARATLALALDTVLRLFAPFLPFVTEEVWSWWRPGSVHRATWPGAPVPPASAAAEGAPAEDLLGAASAAIRAVRRAKSDAHASMRAEVASLVVRGPARDVDTVAAVLDDVRAAGRVADVRLVPGEGEELSFAVVLAG